MKKRRKEKEMKKAVVTGAAGFAGCNLTEHLIEHGYEVYAVIRGNSAHNDRLKESEKLHFVTLDMTEISELPDRIGEKCDIFFHLIWTGSRDDFAAQYANVEVSLAALRAAAALGCKRFIGTGSQAEYGVTDELITEKMLPMPFSSYGSAKVAACYLTKNLAQQLQIDWIWGRIFSLIGKYEPAGRMLPDLAAKLRSGEQISLSSCRQNWDYLDAGDAAEALIALAEYGRTGEIYNIASGDYHPLRVFTEKLRQLYNVETEIDYGEDPIPFVSLQPSTEKIHADTGWKPNTEFVNSVSLYG